uniref:Putative secreted protein n=1 Tax=Anopheles darlingi TaxID=43151 RepID=A0A2M4DEK0_ANODA
MSRQLQQGGWCCWCWLADWLAAAATLAFWSLKSRVNGPISSTTHRDQRMVFDGEKMQSLCIWVYAPYARTGVFCSRKVQLKCGRPCGACTCTFFHFNYSNTGAGALESHNRLE